MVVSDNNFFSVTVRNILSYEWKILLGFMFSSLFTEHKVAKEYIFKTAFQKDKSEPDSLTKNNPYFET